MNETSHDIAVEQYLWWQSQELTHQKMMWAIHRSYVFDRTPNYGRMTGDEVIAEMADAWNELGWSRRERQRNRPAGRSRICEGVQ